MQSSFATTYPNLQRWITTYGWLEMGHIDGSQSVICLLDEGGVIWEDGGAAASIDDALRAGEAAISAWMSENLDP